MTNPRSGFVARFGPHSVRSCSANEPLWGGRTAGGRLLRHLICCRLALMGGFRFLFALVLLVSLGGNARPEELTISDDDPLLLPAVGAHQLRLITPSLLELTLVTTKPPDPAPVHDWDFVSSPGAAHLPE